MDYPDLTNGLFEVLGALAILGHIVRVLNDKSVAGVSIWAGVFFSMWGVWNLWYYPHLDQWWSFYGTLAIVTGNLTWISLLVYYKHYFTQPEAPDLDGCEAPPKRCETCRNRLVDAVHLVAVASKLRRLIHGERAYIALLEEELIETVPLANSMGWNSTRFGRGQGMREAIKEMELDAGMEE